MRARYAPFTHTTGLGLSPFYYYYYYYFYYYYYYFYYLSPRLPRGSRSSFFNNSFVLLFHLKFIY